MRSSTRASLVVTFASIAAAALGNIVAYKVVALVGDPALLSDYSVDRRYLTFLIPLLALGGGVAIPLRVSIRPRLDEGLRILYLQLFAAFGLAVVLLGLVALVPQHLIESTFTGTDRGRLTVIVVMAYAANCTGMLYGLQRGLTHFRQGAWVLVLANGVFPAVSALAVRDSVELALLLWAALSALTCVTLLDFPGLGEVRSTGSVRWSVPASPGCLVTWRTPPCSCYRSPPTPPSPTPPGKRCSTTTSCCWESSRRLPHPSPSSCCHSSVHGWRHTGAAPLAASCWATSWLRSCAVSPYSSD